MRTPHHWIAAVALTISWLGPTHVHAQAGPDDVAVITHGGTKSITLVTVDDEDQVSNLNQFVLPDDAPTELIASVRALPDGSLLLAGVGDARVVRFTPGGESLDAYVSPRRFPEITSAAIAGYASNGLPTQLLITDAASSQAIVYDLRREQDIWARSLFLPTQGSASGSQGAILQGAVMPGGRIALTTYLPNIDTWAIDIFTLATATELEMRQQLTSRPYPQQPAGAVEVPELERARDMTALDPDTLLIASATSAFALGTDGAIEWSIELADFPEIGGEIAAARKLDSGRIAIATFEPGVWTQIHPNHRVHWFEVTEAEGGGATIAYVRSSTPLQRAPKALGALRSTGGTGTFQDTSGLGGLPSAGAATDLELTRELLLTPESVSLGQRLSLNFEVTNTSDAPVSVTRFAVATSTGVACQEAEPTTLLVETNATVVEPMGTFTLDGSRFLAAPNGFTPGTWCAYAALQDDDGAWVRLGDTVTYAITGQLEETLETEDLGLEEFDDSDDPGPMDDFDVLDPPEVRGCGCQQPAGRPSAPFSVVLVALMFGWVLQRRR